jgi:2-oxo-4-hydroxy-4-carboxy-5-ureidoimidazoline decarboxylase
MTTSLQANLERLNSLPTSEAESELAKCCGSKRWAQKMIQARPFANWNELTTRAEQIWWSLDPIDWLEAFQSHPKIGEKKATAATGVEAQKWSEDEQYGIRNSSQQTMDALAVMNREYEKKFDYIFIVCATGKSSKEMLEILRARLDNPPEDELRIAAAEQARITQLRLKKLIDS